MSAKITAVTDATFQTAVLNNPRPVLVDFWAEWCTPCRSLNSILDAVAEDYPEICVVKVNADENPLTTKQHRVRGLPSLVLFVEGIERERAVGMTSKTNVALLLDPYLEEQ